MMRIIIIFLIYIQFTFITNVICYRSSDSYYGIPDFITFKNGNNGGSDDGDNCHGDNCHTSNNHIFNNILSGVEDGAKKLSHNEGTIRFVKNGKISPKYYKNGWVGGSKAKIKTYKIGKFGKIANKGLKLFSIGTTIYNVGSSFVNDGVESGIKTSVKELISFGGSTLGSLAFPVVGSIIGGYIGDKIGEKIGEALIK